MSDIYKIGVAIMLTDGLTPALAMLSHRLLGVHRSVQQINSGFGGWRTALLGAAGVMSGTMIIGAMAKIADRGKDIVHQFELMKIQGMDSTESQLAAAEAMRVSSAVLTTTYAENLKHIRELRYAFGDTGNAVKFLEPLAKANMVLGAVKGGSPDQVWDLVKSLEQKGLTADPAQFASYVETMTKAVVASGGKVTPAQFYGAFKYGRTAMLGWDETFIGQYLPRLIQSMSGGSGSGTGGPGNALMSAFAKVVQGQMPKKAAEEFERMGLASGVSHIKGSSQSTVGGIKGADLFLKNPYEWVQQILVPALGKHGITKQFDVIQEISKLFPVRTASQIVAEMALQGRTREGANSPFEKDARLSRMASGLGSYEELIRNDYSTALLAFNQQFGNLLDIIGSKFLQPGGPVVSALSHLTVMFNNMSQWSEKNTGIIQTIGIGITALGGALIGTGGIAILAAIGPAGWFIAGIIAIGAAFAAFPDILKHISADWAKSKFDPAHVLPGVFGPGGILGPSSAPGVEFPGQQGVNMIHGNVYMDRKKVGEIVTESQVSAMNGPMQGSAYFNPAMTQVPFDLSYAR